MKKGEFDVCVTTYEALRFVPELAKKYAWYYIVFDEAHKLKNCESETFRLSQKLKSERRLLMTGTPLQNNIGELWCLLNFLMPSLFTDKSDFNEWFDMSASTEENDADKM